uniref:Golgi SNAP receptor complex member 1 n=1 Tax=Rhizophora mucronata TaxID=61149 RepID=A0A2P2KJ70_RHIMU
MPTIKQVFGIAMPSKERATASLNNQNPIYPNKLEKQNFFCKTPSFYIFCYNK